MFPWGVAAFAAPPALAPVWTIEADERSARMGQAVALADVNGDGFDDVLLGMSTLSHGANSEGGAGAWLGSPTGPEATRAWSAEADEDDALLGQSLASAGDVNGDGYEDVVVGLPTQGFVGPGRAWAFYGSATGLGTTPDWAARSLLNRIDVGGSVASAGDVNGDGYDDVVVGGPQNVTIGIEPRVGLARVFLGSATGLALVEAWEGRTEQAGDSYGAAVGSAGDVDGDGLTEVVVGAPVHDLRIRATGRVYVYGGSATGPDPVATWTLDQHEQDAEFGTAVAGADVDADGFSDLLVGAPFGGGQPGQVYLYAGSPTGLDSAAAWSADEPGGEQLGIAIAAGGDVNGDGFSDAIVGSEWEGNAFVYLGSTTGLSLDAAWLLRPERDQPESLFGHAVAMGDTNGDGFDDVLVGAPHGVHGETFEGIAYVWLGAPTLDEDGDGIPDDQDVDHVP